MGYSGGLDRRGPLDMPMVKPRASILSFPCHDAAGKTPQLAGRAGGDPLVDGDGDNLPLIAGPAGSGSWNSPSLKNLSFLSQEGSSIEDIRKQPEDRGVTEMIQQLTNLSRLTSWKGIFDGEENSRNDLNGHGQVTRLDSGQTNSVFRCCDRTEVISGYIY